MILDIYKDALEYSFQDGIALLKLGLMFLLSFLVIPIFLISGYSYRVMEIATKGMINGGEKLPYFDDAISMFVDGIKVFVVEFIYFLIPIVIGIIFMLAGTSIGAINNSVMNAVLGIGILLTILLTLFFYLFSSIAVAHMAANDGSMGAAFDFKTIFNIMKSIGWLRLIAFYLGLIIIMFVIVTVVGFIIGFIAAVLGISGSLLNFNPSHLNAGVFGISWIITNLVFLFIVGPYLSILQSRSVGLVYNLQ